MYPGTIVNWHDMSGITSSVVETIDNSPLYLHLSSFDKGPEDLRVVKGQQFYKLYGNKMNFDKHGQPAIQAANIIDAGGTLLIKRLVAKDATLANMVAVATVNTTINAIKADSEEANGKTLDEIITGNVSEPVEYTEELSIVSRVGSKDNTTTLTVTPSAAKGNVYFWAVTDSDVLLPLNEDVNKFTVWDGASEIPVVDGTKIIVVEADKNGKAKKCGVVVATSALPNPANTSVAPTNDLNALYITSKEGTVEGKTDLVVSPAKMNVDNEYFYKVVTDTVEFPAANTAIAQADFTDWVAWDGASEIEIADDTEIILCEFATDVDEETNVIYTPVKGASVVVTSKLAADTRETTSIDLIVPTEDKYIVATQNNKVKWSVSHVTNCKTYDEVLTMASKAYKSETNTVESLEDGSVNIVKSTSYPLFVVTDNGRGVSNKAIKIVPDYNQSKDMENMFYNVSIFEGTTGIESTVCTLNPSAIFDNTLYGINKDTAVQVLFGSVPGMYNKYMADLSKLTGYDLATLKKYDCIFMTNNKGSLMNPYVLLDEESIDLQSASGVELKCGTNGEFGDAPFGTKAWTDAAIEVLDGTFDDIIWDVDTYKIAAVFDANYPKEVKDKIAEFVIFREDCVYFRDYGIDIMSYPSIVNYHDNIDADKKSKFILDYYTTYEIRDPETKVRERVTCMYDLARAMVTHFANGCYRPMAGVANNMILTNAIEGTINFTPRNTPSVNQKALLDDMRVNYAIFEDGRCVVQSLYTSQEDYTQLSYGNNVLAIQEVVRSIRTACPKQRFTFASGSDFSSYADAVNALMKGFQSNFAELRFEYQQNTLKAAQKIFYASVYFKFNNWAQTEVFEVYALNN